MRLLRCFAAAVLLLSPVLQAQVTPAEYHARRAALAARLHGGFALVFAAEEPTLDLMPFRQDEDFYYLTGSSEPGAALLVESELPAGTGSSPVEQAQPFREILFLPQRNLRLEHYTGRKLDPADADAVQKAGVDNVQPMTAMLAELVALLRGDDTHNFSRRAYAGFYVQKDLRQTTGVTELLATALGLGSPGPVQDVRGEIADLRNVKSPAEIALLQKAASVSAAAHRVAMRSVKPGTGENVIDGLLYSSFRSGGCERPSYASIVGSGPFSTQLHYSQNNRTMQSGDVVVIDAGCEYSMYAADITRTLPVNGQFTARQREIYDIVLGAQRAAAAAFVSGKSMLGSGAQRTDPAVQNSLDKVAYEYINSHGKDLHGQPLGKYFIHGLGHGVGIDVHDPLPTGQVIGPGTAFTIEPGIYIPEENLGVRIEDTFYVDRDGKLVNMSADLPHTADEVEAAMRGH